MNFSIETFYKMFNAENIHKATNSFNKGMDVFDKVIQDFGTSMDQMTRELNESSKDKPKIWSEKYDNSEKFKKDMQKFWGSKQ